MSAEPTDLKNNLEKFRAWAIKHFAYVPREDIEELVQHVAVVWFEGKRLHAAYNHLAIDYFRKHGKRMGRAKKVKAGDLYQQVLVSGDKIQEDSNETLWSAIKDKSKTPPEILPEKYLKGLKNVERAVIVLYFQWGFNMKEIGHALGVTECRISQILSRLYKVIKKNGVTENE
jgi:DNA-directed RNA polymerase specialized sigma24 family protein